MRTESLPMEFRHLRTFEAVASLMSFQRATRVLHCTQSTISVQIKALEEDLGTPVFERLGGRIALTASGELLLKHVRKLLEYEKEVYTSVRGESQLSGVLSLRVPQSVGAIYLPEMIARFHRAYPKVGFDISNCGYHRLTDELRSGVTDSAFLLSDCLDERELHCTNLGIERLVFVGHPSSPLAGKSGLSIGNLDGSTFLLPKHDCGYRMGFERSLKEANVQIATLMELNCVSAIIRCVIGGIGVALLPRIAVEQELERGQLVELDWKEPIQCKLLLLRHRDKELDGALGAWIDTVEGYFRELGRNIVML